MQMSVLRRALVTILLVLSLFSGSASAEVNLRNVYVASFDGVIYEVDPRTGEISVFADTRDGLENASALTFDRLGNLLVSSLDTDQVFSFSGPHDGVAILDFSDGINDPFGENGLAFDDEGHLYVSELGPGKIWKFPSDARGGTVFADTEDGIERADGLAFDSKGDLLVANRDGDNILKIGPDGLTTVLASTPCDPFSIDVHSNGDVFYACGSGDVYRWDGGDPATEVFLGDHGVGTENYAIALSSNELELLMTTDDDGELLSINPEDGEETVLVPRGLLNGQSIGVYRAVPKLAITGSCPGELLIQLTEAAPNGTVAIVRGASMGESAVPGGSCVGTRLPLNPAALATVILADANGEATLSVDVEADDCSGFVAAVDVTSCFAGPAAALSP